MGLPLIEDKKNESNYSTFISYILKYIINIPILIWSLCYPIVEMGILEDYAFFERAQERGTRQLEDQPNHQNAFKIFLFHREKKGCSVFAANYRRYCYT